MIIKVAQLEARRNSIKKLLEQYDIKDGITYENGNTIYLKTLSLNTWCSNTRLSGLHSYRNASQINISSKH